MSTTKLLWRSLLLGSAAAIAPLAAQAQNAPISNTVSRSGALQEVVVTAARRAQNLQKTSIAVVAISGTTIQKQGESNLLQVLENVPSVNLNIATHGYDIAIRGQGNDLLPPGSGQGAVALESDGVYDLLNEAGLIGYYDLARVEVLPGPQGTLYGVNSDGGVVNVISNTPVLGVYSGGVAVTLGNYALYRAEAHVNVPLGPVLAFRLAGAMINRHGYLTPNQGDAVGQSVRPMILYKPNDAFSVLVEYELDHIGGVGPSQALAFDYPNGDVNNYPKNPWSYGDYTTSGPSQANSHLMFYDNRVNGTISYRIGNYAVLNIMPAYVNTHTKIQECDAGLYPGAVGPGVCNDYHDPALYEQIQSEERITNAPGSFLTWDVGAYHWNYRQYTAAKGNPTYYGATSNAGFGEVTYPILPTLRLIGGVRQSYDSRFSLETPENATSTWYIARANFSHFDYRIGLEWDTGPQSMQYFTVATGYRPGGFNQNQVPGAAPSLYRTEQITSFELGSKNRFFDNRMQIDGDAFYYDQSNYELVDQYRPTVIVDGVDVCNNSPATLPSYCASPTLNLNAYVIGLEFQARYSLTPNDLITASGTYLDAKFSNKQNDSGCISPTVGAPTGACYFAYNPETNPNGIGFTKLNGLVQAHSPTFAGSTSYQHVFNLATGAQVTAGVQFFVSTGYYVIPTEISYTYQPAYWKQNASLEYTSPAGNWSINAYIRNISNYAVKGSYQPTTIEEPRTFGATGTWNF